MIDVSYAIAKLDYLETQILSTGIKRSSFFTSLSLNLYRSFEIPVRGCQILDQHPSPKEKKKNKKKPLILKSDILFLLYSNPV